MSPSLGSKAESRLGPENTCGLAVSTRTQHNLQLASVPGRASAVGTLEPSSILLQAHGVQVEPATGAVSWAPSPSPGPQPAPAPALPLAAAH